MEKGKYSCPRQRDRDPLPPTSPSASPAPSGVLWMRNRTKHSGKQGTFKHLVTYPIHVHHLKLLTKWTWKFRHQSRGLQKAACCREWRGFMCRDTKKMFGTGMGSKDPLEWSSLGSGWKACIHAQHSALTMGRSLSSQTSPGLSLSWEVPSSSFSPTHRLKHKMEEKSSKVSPVWGYQNLWRPVTGGPLGWGEFQEGRKRTFLSLLLKQSDLSCAWKLSLHM